jgi:hypothetical protein
VRGAASTREYGSAKAASAAPAVVRAEAAEAEADAAEVRAVAARVREEAIRLRQEAKIAIAEEHAVVDTSKKPVPPEVSSAEASSAVTDVAEADLDGAENVADDATTVPGRMQSASALVIPDVVH